MRSLNRFFVDFDGISMRQVMLDMVTITRSIGRIKFSVFETSNGHYHVDVRCDGVSFDKLMSILEKTSCDEGYVVMMKIKRAFYHRVGSKFVNGVAVSGAPCEVSI